MEEGEKNTKYFLNLEKSRANSKILEKVTDENGHTVTKQADIMNVQKVMMNLLRGLQTDTGPHSAILLGDQKHPAVETWDLWGFLDGILLQEGPNLLVHQSYFPSPYHRFRSFRVTW